MRDLAQKFRRVSFFLERITFIRGADDLDASSNEFPFLSLSLRRDQRALNNNRSACAESLDIRVIRQRILLGNDLETAQRRTVIQFDERKIL